MTLTLFSLPFSFFTSLFFIPGKYPVKAVEIMSKIALEAEAALFHRDRFDELRRLTPKPTTTVQTTAIAAVDASFSQHAAAIITLTRTGRYDIM